MVGRGIHPNDLPNVFDRFYQGTQKNVVLEGGTGIGLALAKEYARLFEGTLIAESTYVNAQPEIASKTFVKM